MIKVVYFFLILLGFLVLDFSYLFLAIGLCLYFLGVIIFGSNQIFVFREWTMLLYGVNYLLSPALTYKLQESSINIYQMKIEDSDYFNLAIPGFFCLYGGLMFFNSRIFKPNRIKILSDAKKNESLLQNFFFWCVFLRLIGSFFPSELAFFVYLVSLFRFVAAFSLYSINPKKNWIWVFGVLLMEFYFAILGAMYHDAIMWLVFFGIYYLYLMKPSITIRFFLMGTFIMLVLIVQGVKSIYREKVWRGSQESSVGLFLETTNDVDQDIFGENNLMSSLSRSNQAWIFASTVERMQRIGDFQGLHILGLYTEAALLPRFLAPHKLMSGDKKIFNAFSGHQINDSTSMGLGVFADGYIAFGYWGVMFFSFGLGLLFSLTFRIIESWARLSEFYVLMMLPILNYAVRPDCELQTTINHVVKGLIVFGILVTLTKFKFVVKLGGITSGRIKRVAIPDLKSIKN